MNDFLLDDEFKSDEYKTSINELLFSRTYKSSVKSIEKILNDNGYFGRFKIETIDNRKFGTDIIIRIHVYLYESSYTYIWPFNTSFNIDRKIFTHNRKAPRGILNDQFMLFHSVNILSNMFKKEGDITSHFDVLCANSMEEIRSKNYGIDNWPLVICKHHKLWGQLSFISNIVSFLSRIGLISNNRFKIKHTKDAIEVCDNLFDINYWYNI